MKKSFGMSMTVRIIAVILASLMCVSLLGAVAVEVFASSTTIDEDRDELKELEARLKAIKQQQQALSDSKADAGGEYENAFAEKLALEASISLLDEEITVTEALISRYQTTIDSISTDIYERQNEISGLYDAYDRIVLYYYMNGNPSGIELLMESDSISSYLTKKDYVSYMLDYMQRVTAQIEAQKLDLEASVELYNSSWEDLKAYKQRLADSKSEYTAQISALEELMASASGDMELTDKQLAAINKEREELEKEIAALNKQIADKYTYIDGDYSWPIAADFWNKCVVTSGFGNRKDPFTGQTAYHNGVDIAAPLGTPVQSVKSGVVIRSNVSSDYGNIIVISHGDGTSTLYAHLSKRLVSVGDTVLQNQVIGRVGATGRATGNHLHFGVYKGDTLVDPADYLDSSFKKYLDKYGYLD